MATAYPVREDNFELELSRVREKIKSRFGELIACLRERERDLLGELDTALAAYLSCRRELERVNEKRTALERTKAFHQNELQTSPIQSVHEDGIARVDRELDAIVSPADPRMISFECDTNKMLAELNRLGKLVEKGKCDTDYKRKKQPLVSRCEKGNGMEQLDWPLGVAVDNTTGNIYIADQSNNCVKVCDSTGQCLYTLGENEAAGKMNRPGGVVIYEDRIIISQLDHCILCYQLNGEFISRIGRWGDGQLEFNMPWGLAVDESNGDIYICDSRNNRIQILNKDLTFKSQFGKDTLTHPRDVKLSKEYIYVVDESNPCLHLFSYNHILQRSVISQGVGLDVASALFFFIDDNSNILISDLKSNCIHIFNSQFQSIHQIPVSDIPTGIAVDKQRRVIVVCQSQKDCLQIF